MTPRLSLLAVGLASVVGLPHSFSGDARSSQATPAREAPLTLLRLVEPTTRISNDGRTVSFAVHGLIHFETLHDLFTHIDNEVGRWHFQTPGERQRFGDGLLRRGVESRIVSMTTEKPLEIVLTHTRGEIERALSNVRTLHAPLVFKGVHWPLSPGTYRDAFLRVRERWKESLNCWSASPSIPGRVLSNWYLIDEGIELFGATYDSTEHFWQAVKYHPDVSVGQLRSLLQQLSGIDWSPWLGALEADQAFYFANTYAVEFLKRHVTRERLERFRGELARATADGESARTAQQRVGRSPGEAVRFTSLEEKALWGDLADVLHLLTTFSTHPTAAGRPDVAAARDALVAHHFDAIYLPGHSRGTFPFLGGEFQELMLEIWKVKFLRLPRLGEVIRSTVGLRLDHFLDDGDSPDIPIPIYVEYLNQIRELALRDI